MNFCETDTTSIINNLAMAKARKRKQ